MRVGLPLVLSRSESSRSPSPPQNTKGQDGPLSFPCFSFSSFFSPVRLCTAFVRVKHHAGLFMPFVAARIGACDTRLFQGGDCRVSMRLNPAHLSPRGPPPLPNPKTLRNIVFERRKHQNKLPTPTPNPACMAGEPSTPTTCPGFVETPRTP